MGESGEGERQGSPLGVLTIVADGLDQKTQVNEGKRERPRIGELAGEGRGDVSPIDRIALIKGEDRPGACGHQRDVLAEGHCPSVEVDRSGQCDDAENGHDLESNPVGEEEVQSDDGQRRKREIKIERGESSEPVV